MIDLERIRSQFPMLQREMNGHPLIYLDTAATAQKPQVVIDTITDFYSNHYGTVHRAVYELAVSSSMAYAETRRKVQRFLNAAHEEEILFTRGTTTSINAVARSFGSKFIQAGDEIVITEIEHHANIVPWQMLCEERGAHLRVIPVNDRAELDMEAAAEIITDRTKLVACVHLSNSTGTIHPIKQIVTLARAKGAHVLVDGAQAAPSMPVDVQDLDVDFYAFSGHKAYGPTGVGILYAKRELLEVLPPYEGGGDMIDEVTFEKTTYAEPPLKFEAGTPAIAQVIGLGAAIDYLSEIGMAKIHAWKQELLAYATPQLLKVEGLKLMGEARNKSSALSFVVDGCHPLDIGTLLDLKGVAIRTGHHCTQPTLRRFGHTATCRASLGLYTTKDEIDRFIELLQSVIQKLR